MATTTTKEEHASTGKPSVAFVVKLVTLHVTFVCQRGPTKKTPDFRSGKKIWKRNVTEDLRVANTDGELPMHALTIGKPSVKPIRVVLGVSSRKLTLNLDTGAAVSNLSENIF